MVDKKILKDILTENRDMVQNLRLEKRDFAFYDDFRYVLIGVRRAGKSFLLFQRMQELLSNGHSWDEMLYINFEDDRLLDFEASDFNAILEVHAEMSGGTKPILFLDEVQNITGWEKFARRLADQKYVANITGSNAKMLSSDVATTLGGRYLILQVYPYDWNEYLMANGISGDCTATPLFDEYMKYGGFPECATLQGKKEYLLSVYQKIYLGDIASRYNVENKTALRLMFRKLAESIMQPIALTRLTNILTSTGMKVSKNTILNYASYAKDAFLILPIKNIADSFTERETNQKYYFVDNGIISLLTMDNKAAQLENMIAVALFRKFGLEDNVYFYNYNVEVDFVVPDKSMAIQVCYDLGNDTSETYLRETKALVNIAKRLQYTDLYIITYNEEREIVTDGMYINVVPAHKWLFNLRKS